MADILQKMPEQIRDLIRKGIYSLYRSKSGDHYLLLTRGGAYFVSSDGDLRPADGTAAQTDLRDYSQLFDQSDFSQISKVVNG